MSNARKLALSCDSWPGRQYQQWLDHGGKPPANENLCHFVRVVVRWWFLNGRIAKVVPPWTIPATAGPVALVAVASVLWPSIVLKVLEAIGVVIGSVAVVCGVVLLASKLYDRWGPQKIKKAFKWATAPIRYLLSFVLEMFAALGKKLCFGHDHRSVAAAVGLTLVAIVILGALAYGFYVDPVQTAIIIGWIVAIVLTAVVVAVVLDKAETRSMRRRQHSQLSRPSSSSLSTPRLTWAWLKNKKEGSIICPLIELDSPESEPSQAS